MTRGDVITAEAFGTMAESLDPFELIRGRLTKLDFGSFQFGLTCANIGTRLESWARISGRGRCLLDIGILIEIGPDTVRGADVAYLSYSRFPKGKRSRGFLRVPPELVVEIIGQGQGWRDMVEKAGEYLRMGVDRVWVIDPDAETLHVFRSDAEPKRLTASDEVADATVLPGFSCKVADIFSD